MGVYDGHFLFSFQLGLFLLRTNTQTGLTEVLQDLCQHRTNQNHIKGLKIKTTKLKLYYLTVHCSQIPTLHLFMPYDQAKKKEIKRRGQKKKKKKKKKKK